MRIVQLGWLVGYLWAVPLTVLGVAQAVLGGARFHSLGPGGVLYFVARRRGAIRSFVRAFRVSAYTWGAVVTFADQGGPRDERLCSHELAHVGQAFVCGPLMPLAYMASSLYQALRGGHVYRDNWFEVRARRRELPP